MSEEAGKALKYAFKLLGYRGRSEAELSRRLRLKGFGASAVANTIDRLKQGGFLDETALALSLRRRAEEVKCLGYGGARMYLRQMGIPKETIEEALEDYDELSVAKRLLEGRRRVARGLPVKVARRRLSDQLRRRGHSAATARKALDSFMKGHNEDEQR
jgi:regulatory protein